MAWERGYDTSEFLFRGWINPPFPAKGLSSNMDTLGSPKCVVIRKVPSLPGKIIHIAVGTWSIVLGR